MTSDTWFAVSRQKGSTLLYLMVGGDRRLVEATAKAMFRDPVIVKLTYAMMNQIIGVRTPANKMPTDFCRGELMMPRSGKYDIVIKVLG